MPTLPYSGRDFDALKAAMLAQVPALAPSWTNMNEGDLGMALLNLIAGVGDMLSYYLDRQADEAFLPTVLQRANLKRLCALIDYRVSRPIAATTTLRFTLPAAATSPLLIPKYTQVQTAAGVAFTTKADATIFTGSTFVDVTGYQGQYQLDTFTANGQDTQLFPLTRPNLAQNFLDVLVGGVFWTEDASETAAALGTAYQVQTDDNDVGSLFFSKFLGSVPTQNVTLVVNSLQTLGSAGNIGSGLVSKVVSVIAGGSTLTVTNTTVATGGADQETIDEARIKAPRNLRRLGRVVSLQDYVDALEEYASVATAQAINHNGYVECYVEPVGAARFFVTAPVIGLAASAGGALAAGTYKVAVTATDAYGETATWAYDPTTRNVLDRTQNITVTLNQEITATITASPGATGYKVYLSTDAGVTWKLVTTLPSTTLSAVITAVPGTAAVTLPATNTTGFRSDDGTTSLKLAAETYLNSARMLGTVFALFNPTYVPIAVTATVKIYDNYLQSDRQGAVAAALTSYFAAGQRLFATDVDIAELYSVIMAVAGVRSVSFTAPAGDTTIGNGQVATLGTVTLTMTGGLAQ